MKHLSIPALTAFLMLAPHTSHAEEKSLQSTLVNIATNANLQAEVIDLQRLFSNSDDPAIRLTYLVKATNIIEIDKESLVTKNSKDWTVASFPRIAKQGEAAAFIIEKKGDFLGKSQDIKVEGTINILTGTKLVPKSFTLLAYEEPFRLDNFVFTLKEDKLQVEGNHKLIKEISVEYNEKMLSYRGSGWSDNRKTYNYTGIGKGAKITISYWSGVETIKVHFSK